MSTPETEIPVPEDPQAPRLSLGVAARLSRYLQVLTQARKMGKETISSRELSEYTHVNPTQIRRDLSGFGRFGKRGVGYNVDGLIGEIRTILQTAGQHPVGRGRSLIEPATGRQQIHPAAQAGHQHPLRQLAQCLYQSRTARHCGRPGHPQRGNHYQVHLRQAFGATVHAEQAILMRHRLTGFADAQQLEIRRAGQMIGHAKDIQHQPETGQAVLRTEQDGDAIGHRLGHRPTCPDQLQRWHSGRF